MVVFGEVVENLYFADLPHAVSYYTGPLGFLLSDDPKPRLGPGTMGASVVRRGQATIWLSAAIPELVFPKHANFYVSDVNELFAEMTTSGASIDGSPHCEDIDEYGGKTYEFSVLDPERNQLTFWQYYEAAAERTFKGDASN
jgi:hypothetical protein